MRETLHRIHTHSLVPFSDSNPDAVRWVPGGMPIWLGNCECIRVPF